MKESSVAQRRAEILRKKKMIQDSIAKRRSRVISDSKKYRKFRISDSYKSLLRKIKDELEETVNTQEAVEVAIEALENAPAEQVVAACVEVLAGTIDVLQENVETLADALPEDEPEEDETAKKVQDAVKRAKAILAKKG